MEFKISKKQIFIKLTSVIIITLVVAYLFSALMIVNNRINYSLTDTTWITKDRKQLKFNNDVGRFIDGEAITYFEYTQKRGYVICKNNDVVVFELVGLSDNRLFSITTNIIFYDTAFLS